MKITKRILGSLAAIALLGATQASALSIGDANYLGSINDGIPSSPANEVVYINHLATLAAGQGDTAIVGSNETYNRQNSTLAGPFPTAVETGGTKTTQDDPPTTIDATGYTYVLGKYDAAQAGSLVWYFAGGASGNVTLPSTYNGKGLSHISLYNPGENGAPDGGTTAALLGLGLIGLSAMMRRKA